MRKYIIQTFIVLLVLSSQVSRADDCNEANKLLTEARSYLESDTARLETSLRSAVKFCPSSSMLHYNLALALNQRGDNIEAENELNQALSLDRSNARAMNALAYILYVTDGDVNRALAFARKAVKLEPVNRDFKDTLEMIEANVDNPPPTTTINSNGLAVVIGNKKYFDSSVPPVNFADNDASIMKKYLKEVMGFNDENIIYMRDAKYIDFVDVFGDTQDHQGKLFKRTKSGQSEIFIYYSGHGIPDIDSKRAYIATSDIKPDSIKMTGYSLDTFYRNIAKLNSEKKPKNITIVFDACFSGVTQAGPLIKNASPMVLELSPSSPALIGSNTAIFTSSSRDQVSSSYNKQRHNLFTYFFLRNIRDAASSGQKITSGTIAEQLAGSTSSVYDQSLKLYNREQSPQFIGDRNIVLIK